ncbi:MAG TPA: adenylate/guanylate cyclase domain-containing protein [Geminicoccaceae bacterium]
MARRLAAILAADVVGYSRLMAVDEAGTHARLTALRKEFIEPKIAEHHGRVVKLVGDGVLVEFGSVVDAVECAAAIQTGVAERQADLPAEQRIAFRIGINIGDIIIEGDDIYGDGVNVAARLEQLADPGEICVSRNVYKEVKNKIGFGFKPAAEHKVKNIPEPLMVYRLIADRGVLAKTLGLSRATTPKWRWVALAAAALVAVVVGAGVWAVGPRQLASLAGLSSSRVQPWELPAEPSIAVLPFANLTNDPEQEYFVDGITSDIITDLSRFSTLFVISANSTFRYKGQAVKGQDVARELGVRYLLEGSVQRTGEALRINAQLIDAISGQHVWAEHYDRPAKDFFAVQREITQNIVGTIGSERGGLLQAELERIAHSSTENLAAYEFFLRGVSHDERETKEDNLLARRMFEKAIQTDPSYARAIAELSLSHLHDIWGNWTESREQALLHAEEFARRAIEVDRSEPLGYAALGFVYQLRARNDQAIPLIERAHALNPNDYFIKYSLGYAYAYAGSPEQGIALIKEAHRLNPEYPEGSLRDLAQAYFFAHRYQDAIATLSKIVRRHRTSYWLYLAASHAQLDQIEKARAAVAEALKLDSTLTLAAEIKRREENGLARANAEHLRQALRKAGMPE